MFIYFGKRFISNALTRMDSPVVRGVLLRLISFDREYIFFLSCLVSLAPKIFTTSLFCFSLLEIFYFLFLYF